MLLHLLLVCVGSSPSPDLCSLLTGQAVSVVPGPASLSNRAEWFNTMKACKKKALDSIAYDGSFFEVGRLSWTQHGFTLPMVQGFDRFLWNGSHYTVDKYLDDVETRCKYPG